MATMATIRADARAKLAGEQRYTSDLRRPGMCEAALVRSGLPSARLVSVDAARALGVPGVLAVLTGAEVGVRLWGRMARDIPALAVDRVRYVGEPVAVVIAETRAAADRAVELVEVDYEPLEPVLDALAALDPTSPAVHEQPWLYPSAAAPEGSHNVQSRIVAGDLAATEAALAASAHVVDQTYTSPRGHHGYIEPQACVAEVDDDGRIHVWMTNKQPYRLRAQLSECLGIDQQRIVVEPVAIGGDFGGKGAALLAPICVLASEWTRRPVRIALHYDEDLSATNPRHGSRIRVRLGSDGEGRFSALAVDAVFDGGAYAGCKVMPDVNLPGMSEAGTAYGLSVFALESVVAYTNSVPGGHMRAPGAPQLTFALESAVDELAALAGIDPVELRRRNVLRQGEPNLHGTTWTECRGGEVLEAAVAASRRLEVPPGWLHGRGVALYDRPNVPMRTTLRLSRAGTGDPLSVEVPFPDTGTGSYEAVRAEVAEQLGLDRAEVVVRLASTAELPPDAGVGGSWVTASALGAAAAAARAWKDGGGETIVASGGAEGPEVTSFVVQLAQVALDPATGAYRVLEVLTAVDSARVVNPRAHQMQIDGGAAMGYGFASLEDLDLEGGQVGAGTLGEFRIPTAEDVPAWRTVLVEGSLGVEPGGVKAIGELSNVPTAAAVANALADAGGVRLRSLPLTAEKVWRGLIASGDEGAAMRARR